MERRFTIRELRADDGRRLGVVACQHVEQAMAS